MRKVNLAAGRAASKRAEGRAASERSAGLAAGCVAIGLAAKCRAGREAEHAAAPSIPKALFAMLLATTLAFSLAPAAFAAELAAGEPAEGFTASIPSELAADTASDSPAIAPQKASKTKKAKSIAGAKTTRVIVWAGSKRVKFTSVTLGSTPLVEGKDFTVGYLAGEKRAGTFKTGETYTAVLTGIGAYKGVHRVEFRAYDSVRASQLRQENPLLAYTGRAVAPRLYKGDPQASDRELVPARYYSATFTHRLFSARRAVKRTVGYVNYANNEYYQVKVTGKTDGSGGGSASGSNGSSGTVSTASKANKQRIIGSRTFTYQIYKPVDVGACTLSSVIPVTCIGSTPDFSLWYPTARRSADYGDYVPSFLYTVSYLDAKGAPVKVPMRAGVYTLVVKGDGALGCKGQLRREVVFVKKAVDIDNGAVVVKVTEPPSAANGYRPRFKVVRASNGLPLPQAYYSCYYVDNFDQVVKSFAPNASSVSGTRSAGSAATDDTRSVSGGTGSVGGTTTDGTGSVGGILIAGKGPCCGSFVHYIGED